MNDLQDELMSLHLRETQAQAEVRELRQRVVELETQVSVKLTLNELNFLHSASLTARKCCLKLKACNRNTLAPCLISGHKQCTPK